MEEIKTDDEFIDDADGIVKKKVKKPKDSEYMPFFRSTGGYHMSLKEAGLEFDVSNEIGLGGSKEIYKGNGFEMKWCYIKRSGEHKKNNGRINIYGNALLYAYLDIEKGRAVGLIITKSIFSSEIKAHKEMPFYKEITSLFSK